MIKYWKDYILIKKSGLFDPVYYLINYPDVRKADIDPLMHFVSFGWKEGRNPSGNFNTTYYSDLYPDVKWAKINPLLHYIKSGQREGRRTYPSPQAVDLLTGIPDKYYPKVSIIVPNYNHAAFLEQRLNSIYKQTYNNIEVLLLDDYSQDNSRDILRGYERKYSSITKCIFNDNNSGSPFAQWKNGISKATGDLVWIAESDDFCDLDFLEKIVPSFFDDSVLLTYSHIKFIDREGKHHPFAFEGYVGQLDNKKWNASYIETAHNEVNHNLGLLNTIPNVSSVVIRKVNDAFPIFHDTSWVNMKVCGDWLFYLYLIRGGKVAYCAETNDYYRIHNESSSKKTHCQDVYYQEHEKIACAIAELYKIPMGLITRFYEMKLRFFLENVVDANEMRFQSLFDIKKVKRALELRKPNVLMSVYAFSYGGGEIFPVKLANALYEQGVAVTVFDGGYELFQEDVRKMLYPMISIIKNQGPDYTKKIVGDLGIDIIHTHHASMENYFACVNSDKQMKLKFVGSMHGMYELMTNFEDIISNIYKNVDYWVYAAEKNIAPFKKSGLFNINKFEKIKNGMNRPKYSKIDLSDLGVTQNSFVICLASRALEEKGWQEAIDAVLIAKQATNRDLHLLLIGEGPMYDALLQKSLPDCIHLLGYKANLDDYIASSQLGLLPTYFLGESYPLVLIQFIFAGIPVVASNIGEIYNMIRTSDGEMGGSIIELKSGKVTVSDLTREIEKMITDQDFYRSCSNTISKLINDYRIEETANKYLSVYQKLRRS